MNNAKPDRDRRVRQADRLARILNVLRLIQSRGKWNARSIAEELEVTERTVYRDLQALEFAGVPYYFDDAEQSYRVRSDYRFAVPNLTEAELIGQAVATVVSRSIGISEVGDSSATTQKIAASTNEESKQLLADVERVVCVLGLQLADQSSATKFFSEIQRALIEKKFIFGTYSSPYETTSIQIRLTPIRLCLIKNAWYLIAQAANDQPRTYRVARFETLEVTDESAIIPEHFDLRQYLGNAWAVFRGDKSYSVRIRFLPNAARIVLETNWHHTQTAEPQADGSVILCFTIDGLEEICNWLLGWSGRAEVLEPKELRTMLAERLHSGWLLNQ